MNQIDFIQLISYLLPAIVVGIVSFYFFDLHIKNENKRRLFLIRKENQKEALPIRLQAYERMTLFLERISPGNLLFRIKPDNADKDDYENKLINSIEQEFEHNLAQQIYLSNESWGAIKASKNATIAIIRKSKMSDEVNSANKLREAILTTLIESEAPSEAGLAYLKSEVGKLWL